MKKACERYLPIEERAPSPSHNPGEGNSRHQRQHRTGTGKTGFFLGSFVHEIAQQWLFLPFFTAFNLLFASFVHAFSLTRLDVPFKIPFSCKAF